MRLKHFLGWKAEESRIFHFKKEVTKGEHDIKSYIEWRRQIESVGFSSTPTVLELRDTQ